VKRPEYARLLADCQAQYCGARLGLVEPVVRQRVAAFARQPLPTLTRSGCAHLMQVPRTALLPLNSSVRLVIRIAVEAGVDAYLVL